MASLVGFLNVQILEEVHENALACNVTALSDEGIEKQSPFLGILGRIQLLPDQGPNLENVVAGCCELLQGQGLQQLRVVITQPQARPSAAEFRIRLKEVPHK